MLHLAEPMTTPVSSNTAGLTAVQFLAAARRLAEERGALKTVALADGTTRQVVPAEILAELGERLGFGPPCEVNPFRAELCRLPRGYRFACGCETFADFANLNTCIPQGSPVLFEAGHLAA